MAEKTGFELLARQSATRGVEDLILPRAHLGRPGGADSHRARAGWVHRGARPNLGANGH